MSELDELIAAAELGKEAQEFLESNLGKCLIGMAQQEVRLAEAQLGKIDPKDQNGIIVLQRKIWFGEHFEEWLIELLHNGEAALSVYKQQTS